MNIRNFDRFRVQSGETCFMDISSIGNHSQAGSMATAYLMKAYKEYTSHKVEVRKKDNMITLITYHFSDSEIPEYWRDAEVIFSWEEEA